jgi:Nucleotidyl transferase AbiEii toxin, Type IV TA system
MKDYYDVWMLLRSLEIEPSGLRRAVEATFARRSTPVPPTFPEGLTDAFAAEPGKQAQWDAFARNLSATASTAALGDVLADLRVLLAPVFEPE